MGQDPTLRMLTVHMASIRMVWPFLRLSAEIWRTGMEKGLPTRVQPRILARSATAPHPRISARFSCICALMSGKKYLDLDYVLS